MKKTSIKICGISNVADAEKSCELGADFLGLIFVPLSPRHVPESNALQIARMNGRERVKLVGVFKDAEFDEIEMAVEKYNLDFIQCHGNEAPELCARLSRPVIKALEVNVQSPGDLAKKVAAYSNCTKYLLFDRAKNAPASGDWLSCALQILARECVRQEYFFAGGLSAENVTQALVALTPFGVDVASGVESQPGKKDHAKLEQFFKAIDIYNIAAGARSL